MTPDQQQDLRNRIATLCFDYIDADVVNTAQCFVACIGAAAICAAVLPPEPRHRLVEAAEDSLRDHADKRAEEMRSGELDRQIAGH